MTTPSTEATAAKVIRLPTPAGEVLGAVFADPSKIAIAESFGVRAECFVDRQQRALWLALVATGNAEDRYSLANHMANVSHVDRLKACETIDDAADRLWNAGFSLEHASRILFERWRKSVASAAAATFELAVRHHDEPVDAALTTFQAELRQCEPPRVDDWSATCADLMDAICNPDPRRYIPTGLPDLDALLGGGLGRSWLVVVMAPPKSGKTAFAVSNLAVAACEGGYRTMVVSLEMPRLQVAHRLLAAQTGIPTTRHDHTKLAEHQFSEVVGAIDAISKWPLVVDDTCRSAAAIVAKATAEKKQAGLDMLVVDYLGLINNGKDNKQEDLDLSCVTLKRLAVELDIPVVMLSQATLASRRTGGRLSAADGKGTGGIQEHCDLILLPYRSQPKALKDGSPDPDYVPVVDITVSASRHTSCGDGPIPLRWSANMVRFLA